MFAVIEIGGSQYKVSPKDVITVNKLDSEAGSNINIKEIVLFSDDGKNAKIGQPYLEGANVEAKVLEHLKGEKVRVFKFVAKKRQRKNRGHRQELTKLEITSISA